jgi:hypothetical protein
VSACCHCPAASSAAPGCPRFLLLLTTPCCHLQIDLSDDYMLFSLFADKGWEQQIVPIQLTDESGSPSILEMNAQQFKDYVGLLKVLQEAEQMAVEQQQDDGPIDVTAEAAPSNGNKQ